MNARYELRPVGVYDRDLGRVITPADADVWLAYQASLLQGPPDPMPVNPEPVDAPRLYDPVAAGVAREIRNAAFAAAELERKLKIQAENDPILAAFLKYGGK